MTCTSLWEAGKSWAFTTQYGCWFDFAYLLGPVSLLALCDWREKENYFQRLSCTQKQQYRKPLLWNEKKNWMNTLEGRDISIKIYLSSSSSCGPYAGDTLWISYQPTAHRISCKSFLRPRAAGAMLSEGKQASFGSAYWVISHPATFRTTLNILYFENPSLRRSVKKLGRKFKTYIITLRSK